MVYQLRFGLSKKLILFIVFIITIFMAITSLLSGKILSQSALLTADEISFTLLDQTEKRIAQFFNDMKYLAESLAATKAVQTISPLDMKDLFMSMVMTRKSYIRGIYLGTTDGRMYEWGQGKGFTDNVPTFPPGYDPRQRPWYKAALEKNEFSISAPYQYASIDELGITCILPVYKPSGSFIGVLGIDILLDDLKRILEELDIPKQGKALILTLQGEIIASQFPRDRDEKLSLKTFAALGSEKMLESISGNYTGQVDDQEMYFVYKRASTSNWIIAMAMPLSRILGPIRNLLSTITLIDVFLMLLLILSIASIANHLIISPLKRLVLIINKIKQGEKMRMPIKGKDELSLLGEEFNKLLEIVENNSRVLEEKLKQRTLEIWRLQAENTQYKIIEERQRIFRDMHDSIGAKLTNIFFCNTIARDQVKDESKMLKEMIERIENNCLMAVQDLREMILGMGAADRKPSDISKSIVEGVRQRLQAKKISFEFSIQDQDALNIVEPRALEEIKKIFDELVSNVLKHSNASKVILEILVRHDEISYIFSDNGVGFDLDTLDDSISGIKNIRYRVEKLGGTMKIVTGSGRGTSYHIALGMEGIGNAKRPDFSTN